jgi:hypothetical protein
MIGASLEEYEAWYIDNNHVNPIELKRSINRLLKEKRTARQGKHLEELIKYAAIMKKEAEQNIKNVLTESVLDLCKLDTQTGLSFREILQIPDLTDELSSLIKVIIRPRVFMDSCVEHHKTELEFIKDNICGDYLLYRRHSSEKGLFVDSINISLNQNEELTCHAKMCSTKSEVYEYKGSAIYDGLKTTILLEKIEHQEGAPGIALIVVLFDRNQRRNSAMLTGCVDIQSHLLCSIRGALVLNKPVTINKKKISRYPPMLLTSAQMSDEEREIYRKIDNQKQIYAEREHAFIISNFILNK